MDRCARSTGAREFSHEARLRAVRGDLVFTSVPRVYYVRGWMGYYARGETATIVKSLKYRTCIPRVHNVETVLHVNPQFFSQVLEGGS